MTQANQELTEDTRERILDQAERLFCAKDFAEVSVREITSAASCNLGAVNYYFGSKKNLYLEVFRQRWIPRARGMRAKLEALGKSGRATTEEIVRTLIQSMFMTFNSDDERYRHRQLFAREMSRPGEAFELVMKEGIKPNLAAAHHLLKKSVPLGDDDEPGMLATLSVIGQIIYFNLARVPVERLLDREYDDKFINQLVEHITRFSLDGLNGFARKAEA